MRGRDGCFEELLGARQQLPIQCEEKVGITVAVGSHGELMKRAVQLWVSCLPFTFTASLLSVISARLTAQRREAGLYLWAHACCKPGHCSEGLQVCIRGQNLRGTRPDSSVGRLGLLTVTLSCVLALKGVT